MFRTILVAFVFASSVWADDIIPGKGPWPDDLPFPDGMIRYRTSSFTQSIAVVNNRDSITSIRRGMLERKWIVPGGLENAVGWRSDLYRFLPSMPDVWTGTIFVKNGFGHFQPNRGWKRSYADGTFFCDVLSKQGVVFEIRYREKLNGRWESHVAYRDRDARPEGFVPIRSNACVRCHNTVDGPGTGGYGTGLVPGGDTIVSHGFDELER